ncbi:hypothetical protein [Microcoleus sp. FACHB-68]|uniref:hypothetical protein n=1 Tax=Microcoleus sp. FACHB-68 TaxID=2692826 RepID=UPI00168540D8|nr:hypothetical protein [Microcoleus sp. FACHB-68]MBD1937490.1 hypothetical protein [Microcoleus sp. FACHB-68]
MTQDLCFGVINCFCLAGITFAVPETLYIHPVPNCPQSEVPAPTRLLAALSEGSIRSLRACPQSIYAASLLD